MCGICGAVSFDPRKMVDQEIIQRMTKTLHHRGPDDHGYYLEDRVMLGIRRLKIIDLATGHQPIPNEDNTIWVILNGEIYNYPEIRQKLEKQGHRFRTQSDTEVIVHAYEEFGDGCVNHLNGMFAFAIWDSVQKCLFLARDRLGIKPLFYWASNDQIVFGSELKALMAHPDVPRQVDLVAMDQYLSLEYVPGPRTIFQGVEQLPPGYCLSFQQGKIRVSQYWDVPYAPIMEDEQTCTEILEGLLAESVQMQMISDVPLGAFLSGGIDSSSIVRFMSQFSAEPIKTFSIGFEDDTYNELGYAQITADRFETDHHFEIINPNISDLAEALVHHLGEPFADFSIFPTYLVSQLASKTVKVVLSGDGGDEIFAGYDTYAAEQISRYFNWFPSNVREKTLPQLFEFLPPQPAKKGVINKAKRMVEGAALNPALQHTRWMIFMSDGDKDMLYRPAVREAVDIRSMGALFDGYFTSSAQFDSLARQQYVDLKTYLPGDILTKVDRMSMAVSLEARVPLLDHRIVEFAVNLPSSMKLNRSRTKIILRRTMQNKIPDQVLRKPKQGFSIPMKHWLRGPLKSVMTDLLSEDSIRRSGYFNDQTISGWIQEHLRGRANHSHRLWALMVLQLWLQSHEASVS